MNDERTDEPGDERTDDLKVAGQPGPHGAAPSRPAPAAADEPETVRRPGPHGAVARESGAEDAIARAYRRAERTAKKNFQPVTPRSVIAAEVCTALDDEFESDGAVAGPKGVHSRACFIATAAYGDADAPEVEQLRRFRDRRLNRTPLGRAFVRAYYRVSPPFARAIACRPRLRMAVRRALDVLRNRAAM